MPNVGPDGTLVPTVEIRTMRVGVGKGHRLAHQVFIDGNDISADVFSTDIHLDGRGGNVVTLDLVASVVAVESASVELTDATKRGLNAMGWRTDDQVQDAIGKATEVLREELIDAMDELRIQSEADGRVDFAEVLHVLQATVGGTHEEWSR